MGTPMRQKLLLLAIAGGVAISAVALAQGNLSEMFVVAPGERKFVQSPTAPPGLAVATLAGNPAKAGIYVIHTKLPANFKVAPHTHPDAWRITTVLSGTMYFGYGDTFDESKLKPMGPGSFWTESKDLPHFAMTKGEEVVIQIVGEGPTATNPIRK